MMPSWCQGIWRTENIDSTFAGMSATPFMREWIRVGVRRAARRCPAPGVAGPGVAGCLSGSGTGTLAGRFVLPAGEQSDDDRQQVTTAGATGQPGGLLTVGLGVRGANAGEGHARGLGQVGQPVG